MRFLHIADVHLGYQQYNSSDRFNDFGEAFERAICYGVDQQVDAILIAGDLLHKATVEPWAYIQATDGLGYARDAHIPVVAVTGNHDQARYRDQISWLDVLAFEGYLHVLKPNFDEEQAILSAWDGGKGAYVDIGALRVVGLPWYGAMTAHLLPEIASAIKSLPKNETVCTVLLAHAGLEGEMPNLPGCLTYAQLAPLRECVDYLALGHLHKPFEREGWIYNPGSLEVCSMDESRWKKGMYDVTVEGDGRLTARYVPSTHRPFYRESFPVDQYRTPSDLYRALRETVRGRAPKWQREPLAPVVEVSLEGTLQFDRADLDQEVIKKAIEEEGAPLLAQVATGRLTLRGVNVALDGPTTQAELERSVLREIALSDSRYAAQASEWARVMLEIKDLALAERSPETILETLQIRMNEIGEEVADAYQVA